MAIWLICPLGAIIFPGASGWRSISHGTFFSMIAVAIVSLHKSRKSTTTVQKCDNIEYATSVKNNDNNEISEQHKQKTKTETKEVRPSISEDEVSALLHERFQGLLPIDKDRNQKICDKFVLIGIFRYANGSFDETTFAELTFDEFCHIYSTISWLVEKVLASTPNLKENAALYKKFPRPKLLARLSTFSVYTLYSPVTCLPYVTDQEDRTFLLFSNEKIDSAIIEKIENDNAILAKREEWNFVKIAPENFDN